MKGVKIIKFTKKLQVQNYTIPKVTNQQDVLIKVLYAAINPSDVYFSKGQYGIRLPLPSMIGFEGVGQIVDGDLIGQTVAFLASKSSEFGSWSQYCIAKKQDLIPINFDPLYAAAAFVNPLTALAFLSMIQNGNFQDVLFSSSISAVAQMGLRLLKYKIPHLNLVALKRENQSDDTTLKGIKLINMNDIQTIQKCFQRKTIFFDSLAGNIAGDILSLLPNGSQLVNYGASSMGFIGKINPQDLIFRQKTLSGLWLDNYYDNLTDKERMDQFDFVRQNLQPGQLLYTPIYKIFQLDQLNEAIETHHSSRGKGKILLKLS